MLCLISSQKKNWKAIFTLMAVFSNGFTHKASTSSGTFAEKRPASKSSGPETPTSSLARLPLPSSSHHSPPRGPGSSDSRPAKRTLGVEESLFLLHIPSSQMVPLNKQNKSIYKYRNIEQVWKNVTNFWMEVECTCSKYMYNSMFANIHVNRMEISLKKYIIYILTTLKLCLPHPRPLSWIRTHIHLLTDFLIWMSKQYIP